MPTSEQVAMWAKHGVTLLADPWPERVIYRDGMGADLSGTVIQRLSDTYVVRFDDYPQAPLVMRANQTGVRAE